MLHLPPMSRHPIIPIDAADLAPDDARRRAFLKLMAASAALASGACSGPPQEQIMPYARMPELLTPGRPLYYASAFIRRGLAQGVLVESNMGRPTKVEGNPHHPASLGATDVFAQASILQLWDPDRSLTVQHGDALATWDGFEAALRSRRAAWSEKRGAGLRLLTGTITSPTLARQIEMLLARYPEARWHSYDPLHDDAVHEAAQIAFGRAADALYRLDRAVLIVSLDADLFGDWPGAIRHARDFLRQRRSEAPLFANRLLAVEPAPSLCGAIADDRLALPPPEIERLAWRVAARLGVPGVPPGIAPSSDARAARWEAVLARELTAHHGAALVVAGGSLSPQTRALVHLLNAHLGNAGHTVLSIAPVEARPQSHAASIAALAGDMHAGRVTDLVIVGGNPVYDAPVDLEFGEALRQVAFSVHLGLYRDETARRASWHLPQAHDYEQWSDGRADEGTACIVQPLIAPLYGGRSSHQLLALVADDPERSGHAQVRRTWQQHAGAAGFDAFWQEALLTGVIEGTAAAALTLRPMRRLSPPDFGGAALTALFCADPSTGDGTFANNAWLQELPRPFTSLTWDNAALLGPATAQALGVASGDIVRLNVQNRPDVTLDAPVWVLPGHAEGIVMLPLGYGRQAAGRVGDRIGFDAYRLRTLDAWRGRIGLQVRKTGRRHAFAVTQHETSMQGRDPVRMATLEEFRRDPRFASAAPRQRTPDASLYPAWEYKEYKWGMAIDLNACIGCNACTIACQAENNIPVVGKEEVMRGREMHWIRIDRYVAGAAARPRIL
ncbi:MAG TPA: molybdopterin oxidoreductase, partial [Burkholderiaceae bacterium]|nr:molybdopterin oxidoreductase [Burkholderiaceae bacterium]